MHNEKQDIRGCGEFSIGELKLLVALNSGKRVIYATSKFKNKHFKEVDRLVVQKGMKQIGALETVAKDNGFNVESFTKQYRVRHLNRIRKPKKGL